MRKVSKLEIRELTKDETNHLVGGYSFGGGSIAKPNGLINTGNCTKAGEYNKNCVCLQCRPPIETDPNGLECTNIPDPE